MNLPDIFASLATGFAEQFGAPFEDAVAVWPGTATYDTGGSITVPGTPVQHDCKVQFDAPGEQMRADPGFREKDVRLLILAGSMDVAMDTAANVVVASGPNAGTWSVETCQGDPARIGFECRARRIL